MNPNGIECVISKTQTTPEFSGQREVTWSIPPFFSEFLGYERYTGVHISLEHFNKTMARRSTVARRTTNCSGQAATCDCNGLAMVDFHRESLLINEEARKTDNAFASVQCGVTGRLGCIDRSELRYLNPIFFLPYTTNADGS